MTQSYLSQLEAQAVAEEERRHLDDEPAPLWEQIAWARHNIGRLAQTPGLDQLDELPGDRCDTTTRRVYGLCGECEIEASTRFRFGAYELCRTCTLRRLAVRASITTTPDQPAPVYLEGMEQPPNLTRWAKEAGRHITDNAILLHLDEWAIHGDQRAKLILIAQHVRQGLATQAAA